MSIPFISVQDSGNDGAVPRRVRRPQARVAHVPGDVPDVVVGVADVGVLTERRRPLVARPVAQMGQHAVRVVLQLDGLGNRGRKREFGLYRNVEACPKHVDHGRALAHPCGVLQVVVKIHDGRPRAR